MPMPGMALPGMGTPGSAPKPTSSAKPGSKIAALQGGLGGLNMNAMLGRTPSPYAPKTSGDGTAVVSRGSR